MTRSILHSRGPLAALALAGLTLGSLAALPRSEEPDPRAVAEAYLEAYGAMDFDRLETYWSEASVWQDPTSAAVGASPDPVSGATAIRAHLTTATTGLEDLEFVFDERFESAGFVVSVGTMRYGIDVAPPGKPAHRARFELRTVIVLEIRDGVVVRHTDYTDFSHWREQWQAAQR